MLTHLRRVASNVPKEIKGVKRKKQTLEVGEIFDRSDFVDFGLSKNRSGEIIRLRSGELKQWKHRVIARAKEKIKSHPDRELLADHRLRLFTTTQIAELEEYRKTANAFSYYIFDDLLTVLADGKRRIYRLVAIPVNTEIPYRIWASNVGRNAIEGQEARNNNITYTLPIPLEDVLHEKQDARPTDVHFAKIRDGVARLQSEPEKYGAIEVEAVEAGLNGGSYGIRVSDEEYDMLNSVRRPGESNQNLIRRILLVAIDPITVSFRHPKS